MEEKRGLDLEEVKMEEQLEESSKQWLLIFVFAFGLSAQLLETAGE